MSKKSVKPDNKGTIFWGKIKKSKGRGKKLGFPTANIKLSKKIFSGIYISIAKIKNKSYPSVTFIGEAQTFNEKVYQAECHILSFNENIYNQWISVRLLKKIRENKKFSKVLDLVEQIRRDIQETELYFKLLNK